MSNRIKKQPFNMDNFKSHTRRNSEGELFETKPHYASFRGKHNRVKLRLFICLLVLQQKLGEKQSYGIKEIERYTGISYRYLASRLKQLAEWEYLINDGRGIRGSYAPRLYRIGHRGIKLISVSPPELRKEIAESLMTYWQENNISIDKK